MYGVSLFDISLLMVLYSHISQRLTTQLTNSTRDISPVIWKSNVQYKIKMLWPIEYVYFHFMIWLYQSTIAPYAWRYQCHLAIPYWNEGH